MRKKLLSLNFKIEKSWIVYILLFIFYISLMPHTGHGWDFLCWREWMKNDFTDGLAHAYLYRPNFTTDYLPLWHYFLYAFGWFQGSTKRIEANIHWLKMIPLLFEFLGGFVLIKLIRKKFSNPNDVFFYSLLLFLNIGYFYNSLIWGQVDGILATLVLLSLYFALKEKALLSIVFIFLALSFKLQAIIFIPMVGLLLLPVIVKEFSWKNIIGWILVPLGVLCIILLPFALAGDLDKIWKIILKSQQEFPVISMNAYNMWYWFMNGDLTVTSDQGFFAGLTFKSWGLLLFCLASFAALFPLLMDTYNMLRKKSVDFNAPKIFLTAALIPLIFFFFNTEMHERYSHPAIIFMAIYSILTGRYVPYILVTAAYLLNMEDVLRYLHLHKYGTLIFTPEFIAAIYFITILLLFFDLYKRKYNNQTPKPAASLFTLRPESKLQADYA